MNVIELSEYSIAEFIEVTSSKEPVPGGGSVSALVGALGAALTEMVANLTIGKEKYKESEEKMQQIVEEASQIKFFLQDAIEADSCSFETYLKALSLPKSTEEEKITRALAMEDGLKEAARIPLTVAADAARIFPLVETVVLQGNKNAITDAMVAAMLTRTAILGALFNVKINLKSIHDNKFVEKTEIRILELEDLAVKYEKKILNLF